MSTSPSNAQVKVRKHFSSSILLCVRTDQPGRPGWTTGRDRTRRSSRPRRVWRSTDRSTSPRSTRGCGRQPRASALADTAVLRELRTQTFLPWNEKLWDTPNVAHDNPADQRFHASLILGFTDSKERAGFLHGREIESLSNTLAPLTSAIHAYDVSTALTYVKDGTILPHY